MTDHQNDLATINERDPFDEYLEREGSNSIAGQILAFSKGDYLAGRDKIEIPAGTKMVVNMNTLAEGWIRWWDNKPSVQRMGLVCMRFQPPTRDELPDNDSELWERDKDGKPRDPWQRNRYLIMANPSDQEIYTFTTGSFGGITAIRKLIKQFNQKKKMYPNDWPVITLGIYTYDHTDFGRIKNPEFNIVGWVDKNSVEALAEADPILGMSPDPALSLTHDGKQDEIPF